MAKNQVFAKQNMAVFPNLHCFVGTTKFFIHPPATRQRGNNLWFNYFRMLLDLTALGLLSN
jgi:hypothetical protein